MKKFKLHIITPLKSILNTDVRQITFKTPNGMRGILPDHIPFMSSLISHVMKIHFDDENAEYYSIKGGFLKFWNNSCIIITEESYNIKDISRESLEKETEYWKSIKSNEEVLMKESRKAEVQLERLQRIFEKKN